jgi:hypothetical protein
VRRAILDRLERIMFYRADLRKAARREAQANCHPEFPVWWKGSKPRLYMGVRYERAYFPKRNIKVPASWVLARLGGRGANVAVRVQRADPLRCLFTTPGWAERIAAGELRCRLSWLSKRQRARVEAQAHLIKQRKYEEQQKRRADQERLMSPAPAAPDTLGWRGWNMQGDVLVSPVQRTPWHEASLRAGQWSDSAAVRGVAGIHARRLPIDWRRVDPQRFPEIGYCQIHGIVERFGRYVLGTEGWRAEWVVIRELMAPDAETALALMRRYPEVRVHIRDKEGN